MCGQKQVNVIKYLGMADVVKLVNTLDCGSSISWVRVPSFAPFENKCQRKADIFFY